MAEIAVVNASPLIFLAKAGLLDLLSLAAPQIIIPEPVAREITRRGPGDVTVREVSRASWLETLPEERVPDLVQAWDLGAG